VVVGLFKPRFRKIAFTDNQMVVARHHEKFKGKTHREFVEWLFLRQHRVRVDDHSKLKYHYKEYGGNFTIEVEGKLGEGLSAL
jgi:hypothetical protein